jgi:hypothetical protein
MLSWTTLVIVGWLLTVHVAAPQPLPCTFVETKDLTSSEVTYVRRLARPTGKSPWLIFGCRMKSRSLFTVFLGPDLQNGRLRRGRLLQVAAATPPGAGRKPSWQVESTGGYAQVVVPGREPDEVRGKSDYARPFSVDGELDDRTLISVVELIRRSPEGPAGTPPVDGSLPISDVRRTDTGVQVTLESDHWSGWLVTLDQRNGRWAIAKVSRWVV